MKTLPAGLQAHLDDGTTTMAWAWRIVRADGLVLGFTEFDGDLTFDGTTFEPESGLVASEIRAGSDLSVDSQDAEGVLNSDVITETDILDGRWDDAQVEVWRVNWQNTDQRLLLRKGTIGQIRRGRASFVSEIRSQTHILQQTVGLVYQSGCSAKIGDARCKVDRDTPVYRGLGTITHIFDERTFLADGLDDYEAEWFSRGDLVWTTGANLDREAEVILHTNQAGYSALVLEYKPTRPLVIGDAFSVYAGCDLIRQTCSGKFGNILNFRGFPNIPGQDVITRYANDSSAKSGQVL